MAVINSMQDLPGFADPSGTVEINVGIDDRIKKRPFSKKSGGFQSMNLSFNVLKGITKRGYQQPTPIQRKAIPIILEGRDVVAMARTGSGKTACFLIPLFEKLKLRSAKAGARALVLSPTRELALQTLKFIKDIGRFADLKASVILGGDSMDDQFSALHGNPDIIVATPGRFLHVCMEMDLKLNSIEYIVFDEADRLFEMGLGDQLTEIVGRLPDARQSVMFSATLPKVLVEFAKAGLTDPILLRLDVESKLPDQLQLWHFTMRPEEKLSALLVLLKLHIDNNQQTVVFAATKHHVEYLHSILDRMGITNSYIYSNLDPAARKIHAAKFRTGKVKVLVVTDVAARGMDIPQLDNVINYNFPAKGKLFVHRVGRCARAGRSGVAYSLITPDEYAHLLDLHMFLGQPLSIASPTNKQGTIGRIPQSLIEDQQTTLLSLHDNNIDLASMKKVMENGYEHYIRTRPAASSDSNRRVKALPLGTCSTHHLFRVNEDATETLLDQMRNYRPQGTIFEICGKNKSQEYLTMKEKRAFHKEKISAHRSHVQEVQAESITDSDRAAASSKKRKLEPTDDIIEDAFESVIVPKKLHIGDLYKKDAKRMKMKDDNYIPYVPSDRHTEEGLAVNNFSNEANKVQFDLTGDSEETLKRSKQLKKWDRKKKKMVVVEDARKGKIRTESGIWIPETYKSNRYAEWKEKTKADAAGDSDDGDASGQRNQKDMLKGRPNTHWARHNDKVKIQQRKSEMKSTGQILKAREIAERKKQKQKKKKGKGKSKAAGRGRARGKGKSR